MKHFFTSVLIFIVLLAQAQDFAPIGARWIYGSGGGMNYIAKYQFTSIKDTVIDDKTCRKIERVDYTYNPKMDNTGYIEKTDTISPYFVHQDADTVYLFNPDDQIFDRIYVFNVSKGDTITLDIPFDLYTNDEITEFRIRIDSVATETYGTIQVKKYKARALDEFGYGFGDSGWYLDRIGALSWFLPRGTYGIFEVPGPLLCYKDHEISYPDASDCELVTGNVNANLQQEFSVYPNPAKDKIRIKSTLEIDKVEIYSNQGSLLGTSFSEEIATGNLNSGRYLLKIYSGNDFVVKSVVVE